MSAIYTKNLTKTYCRFEKEPGLLGSAKSLLKRKYMDQTAVDSFDFTVEPGEFVGLIGPNGAGKTTLVKMLTGIIAPTSGEISVLGHYPNKLENAFKKRYAVVMGQKSQLFFELTQEKKSCTGRKSQALRSADRGDRSLFRYLLENLS